MFKEGDLPFIVLGRLMEMLICIVELNGEDLASRPHTHSPTPPPGLLEPPSLAARASVRSPAIAAAPPLIGQVVSPSVPCLI